MTTIATGSGPKSWSLYDLWIANGKPTQIIVASFGPATCKIDGFRWTAISGEGCAAGAITLTEADGRLTGQAAGAVMPAAILAADPTLDSVVASVVGVSLATFGIEWFAAAKWAKLGSWVRRLSWADTSQKIRFEEGEGTAKAVAVYQGNTITKRVVKNSDFGAIEFGAIDWIVPGSPAVIDLTNAMLYANGRWSLTHSGRTVTSGGTGSGSGSTGGTTGTGTTTTPVVTPAEAAASEAAATEGVASYCERTLTQIQLTLAMNTATSMTLYGTQSGVSAEQIEYFQTSLLTQGVQNMVNAGGGKVACAGYYEKLILSYFNRDADGDSTSQGEPGTPGSVWFNSTTYPPSDGVGIDGDYYLITPAGGVPYDVMIYFKVAGTWTAIFAI